MNSDDEEPLFAAAADAAKSPGGPYGRRGTVFSSVVSLCATAMGAGVLSLPKVCTGVMALQPSAAFVTVGKCRH